MHGEEITPDNGTPDNGTPDNGTPDNWQACPSGEFARMVGRIGTRERRARIRQLASTGLLSMLLFAVGAILVGGFVVYEEPTFGGITCTVCLGHASEYHGHFVGKSPIVDVELVAAMETHLKMCAVCREKFHQAYPDISLEQLAKTGLRLSPLLPTFAVALSPAGY